METDSTTASDGQSRPPGAACEECRKRKLRCDRETPQCGNCQASAMPCKVKPDRAPRGPKKGYLRDLRNKITILESQLAQPQQHESYSPDLPGLPASAESSTWSQIASETASAPEDALGNNQLTPPTSLSEASEAPFSDLIRAELEQLYFDRVHPSISILHQRRYVSWSRNPTQKKSRICLQHAIWALTSLVSVQFKYLHEDLYCKAVRLLGSLDISEESQTLMDTEQAQAWILITTYESLRAFHHRAWMSAGRVFRLCQLMGLHELDLPAKPSHHGSDFIVLEEKRRTFWMAYLLDHVLSMRKGGPVTLNEHVICTRLPAPDAYFQSGRPAFGPLLSEAITNHSPQQLSLFNECIIFATLCGRALFRGQLYAVQQAYGEQLTGLLDQTHWLHNLLAKRLEIVQQFYPSALVDQDPMVHLANIMGHITIVYSFMGTESTLCGNEMLLKEDRDALWLESQQQALNATEQIVTLTRALADFHPSKIHPFIPTLLLQCVEFLYTKRFAGEVFRARLEDLLATFQHLKLAGDPSQTYMALVRKSCTSPAKELADTIDRQPALFYTEMEIVEQVRSLVE